MKVIPIRKSKDPHGSFEAELRSIALNLRFYKNYLHSRGDHMFVIETDNLYVARAVYSCLNGGSDEYFDRLEIESLKLDYKEIRDLVENLEDIKVHVVYIRGIDNWIADGASKLRFPGSEMLLDEDRMNQVIPILQARRIVNGKTPFKKISHGVQQYNFRKRFKLIFCCEDTGFNIMGIEKMQDVYLAHCIKTGKHPQPLISITRLNGNAYPLSKFSHRQIGEGAKNKEQSTKMSTFEVTKKALYELWI